MHAFLIPYGSAGDVFPFVRLGRALRERGHQVTLVASGYFLSLADKEGLDFVELYPAAEYEQEVFGDPNLRLKMRHYARRTPAFVLDKMPRAYRIIAERYQPGQTVVAAHSWVFGARVAQEKLGVPLATVHLQPLLLGSIHDRRPWLPRPWPPLWIPKLVLRLLHRWIDRQLGPAINAFRGDLGLPPVTRILNWWHSPQRVLGLFPEWFARPQPDWPSNTQLVGFPLFDPVESVDGPRDDLETFLSEGEPPLIFSQGSLVKDARDYFAVSADVAQRLGRRAVFFTPHAEQVPASLPQGVRYFPFVPFRLPRTAAAHVHHGGIGTIAYTLAAGIPQLTLPHGLDQPDNCRRLQGLGVSASLRPRAYRPHRVAGILRHLLDSPAVAERCRFYAMRCREANALEKACRALEQLGTSS
jgi:UDP:flavonoid glycosyltransferase YjiC (YdhE family)